MSEKRKFRPPLSDSELGKHKESLGIEFAKLASLKQEFEGFKSKRTDDFIKSLKGGDILSDEERDIVEIGGNVEETYLLLKAKETEFVDDAVAEQEAILEEFEDDLHRKQGQYELLEVETNFMKSNPDADFEGLVDFIQRKLTGEDTETIDTEANGDRAKFLELAHAKMVGANGKKDDKSNELPTDLSGVAGASGNVDDGDGQSDEDDSYAKKSGLYR